MPLPKPRKFETEDEFVSRCVSNETMESEYPDKDQRLAVCYNLYGEQGEQEEE